jgi:two-component system cell cycle response regulator
MPVGRILIVDDELFFRTLFQEALAPHGHKTSVAASAEEALRALAAEPFDLLLTDILMPGMDGIELVEQARRRDPDLEVVAITADDKVSTAVRAMKAGCADFLVKPVSNEELAALIERALERRRLRREHSQLLTENVQLARFQALLRQSLGILATLDLERLQDVILSVLARVADAQSAAIWIADQPGQLVLRGYRGLVDRSALPSRIDPREPEWAEAFKTGRSFQPASVAEGEAFYVPLAVDEEPMGAALLADRASGRFGPEEQATAASVAQYAAIAVKNARRFQTLERVGLRDRETSAYNLSYFIDYVAKEFYKARRYNRQFSLVLVSIDNLEQLRKAAGRELFRCAIRDIIAGICRVVRDADILAKVSENEYYALLPETDYFGALMFLRRAAEEVRKEESVRKLEEYCPVLLSFGAATFPKDGEDFDELLHHCRARVEDQRGSLVRRLHLADMEPGGFWELVDVLLDESSPLPETSPSTRTPADEELFGAVQREAAREIGRDPRARGLLYLGVGDRVAGTPLISALPGDDPASRAGDGTVRAYLLGPRTGGAELHAEHPLITPVFLDGDQRLSSHQFLLFLSENAAYGLIQRNGDRLFHTADAPLVDALVSKLQILYDLQPM